MNEGDRVRFAQIIINVFEMADTHKLRDRQVEKLDAAIFQIGDTLGFSPEEIEEVREAL